MLEVIYPVQKNTYRALTGQQGKTSPELSRVAFPNLGTKGKNTPLQQSDRPGSQYRTDFSTEWEILVQPEKLRATMHSL